MVSSVERYLAIEHPHYYLEKVTVTRVILVTATICLIAPTGLVSLRIIFDNSEKYHKIFNMFFFLLNSIVIAYCNVKVQITAKRHCRTIQAQIVALEQQQPHHQQEQKSQQQSQQQQQQQQLETDEIQSIRRREFRRTSITSLKILGSFVFYCPFIIMSILQLIQKTNGYEDTLQYLTVPLGGIFIHLQSLANPLITIRLSYIRNEMVRIFLIQ